MREREYIASGQHTIWMNELKMKDLIRQIFPQHLVLSNTRGFLDGLEIDCYIPDLRLGFEYNGIQHYEFTEAFHDTEDSFREQQKRDMEKERLCKERGITLIKIRYDEELSAHFLRKKVEDSGFLNFPFEKCESN